MEVVRQLMPYALLDDQFHSNPKVIAMGLDGAGLYCRALSYCADYLTDGLVPLEWATAIVGRRRKILDHLTGVGAWTRVHVRDQIAYTDRTGNAHEVDVKVEGFWIADYVMFNPSRTEYQATRKKKAKAGRKGAVTRWGDSSSHDTRYGSRHDETANPDVENVGENMAGAMAGAIPHAHARARGPSPSPTPELNAAAAGSTQDAPHAAAADLIDQLETLGLNGAALELATADPDRAAAWLTLAQTEARSNPAGYVLAGLRSREWPATRTTTARAPSKIQRAVDHARQNIQSSWHALDRTGLDIELDDLGIPGSDRGPLYELARLCADSVVSEKKGDS